MSRNIDYGNLMHKAMRGLIRTVLEEVAERGLPGAHHFFITFDTHHPDVRIAKRLAERYPGEMTVVMQHWFDNLEVTDEGFSVTLNFGETPEPLYIPYDAIQTFVDPSVEFGLRFEAGSDDDEDADDEETGADTAEMTQSEHKDKRARRKTPADAEIVSLDSFRK